MLATLMGQRAALSRLRELGRRFGRFGLGLTFGRFLCSTHQSLSISAAALRSQWLYFRELIPRELSERPRNMQSRIQAAHGFII
jgi:hypothetical protein